MSGYCQEAETSGESPVAFFVAFLFACFIHNLHVSPLLGIAVVFFHSPMKYPELSSHVDHRTKCSQTPE